jgi:ribonucleoside-diphosphate reductase alpha chain
MTSISLQYGVPLKALVDKFSHTRFEPSGFTNNREIPIAKSVMDYVFRFLGNRFLSGELLAADEQEDRAAEAGLELAQAGTARGAVAGGSGVREARRAYAMVNQADAPSCMDCGSIMLRNGACYKCANCGGTSGCS